MSYSLSSILDIEIEKFVSNVSISLPLLLEWPRLSSSSHFWSLYWGWLCRPWQIVKYLILPRYLLIILIIFLYHYFYLHDPGFRDSLRQMRNRQIAMTLSRGVSAQPPARQDITGPQSPTLNSRVWATPPGVEILRAHVCNLLCELGFILSFLFIITTHIYSMPQWRIAGHSFKITPLLNAMVLNTGTLAGFLHAILDILCMLKTTSPCAMRPDYGLSPTSPALVWNRN